MQRVDSIVVQQPVLKPVAFEKQPVLLLVEP
jgi:hypothetical protein